MGRARSVPLRIQGRPGAVIVAAPREVACDELRLARLEDYLQARFPEVDVPVVDRMAGPGGSGFVGTTADAGTVPPVTVAAIAEAVRQFTDYGESRR